MTVYTLNLAGAFTVTSRAVEVTMDDMGKLPEHIVAKIFDYGLTQCLSDAASGAAMAAIKERFGDKATGKEQAQKDWLGTSAGIAAVQKYVAAMIGKKIDSLIAGDWAASRGGTGVSEETKVARSIMRALFKDKVGKASPEWKTFDAMSAGDQADKLDAMFDKNRAKLAPVVQSKLETMRAERERNKALDVEIDF